MTPRSLPVAKTAHRGVCFCPLAHRQATAFLTPWTGKTGALIPGPSRAPSETAWSLWGLVPIAHPEGTDT